MKEKYYSNDGKDFAILEGRGENGKMRFTVYYGGWFAKCEFHEIKLYKWAQGLHGNAPTGTAYGYFNASRNGKRIIITV